jgi:hypothetical protein
MSEIAVAQFSLFHPLDASSTLRLNILKIKSFHNAAENISPRAKCDDGRHANARMAGGRKMQDARSLHSLRLFFAEHAQWGKKNCKMCVTTETRK